MAKPTNPKLYARIKAKVKRTVKKWPSAYASGPNPYRSTAEVVAAMSDKRYGKDVSYTEDVQNRLAGSDVFKT